MNDEQPERQDDAMRALLKRSLGDPGPEKSVLHDVQRKLRKRSKGKFYGDGWSTGQERVSYALIAGLMLLVVAIAYFALGPMSVR